MLMKIKASAGSSQDLYTSIPGDEDEILIVTEFIKFGWKNDKEQRSLYYSKLANEIGRSACEYNISDFLNIDDLFSSFWWEGQHRNWHGQDDFLLGTEVGLSSISYHLILLKVLIEMLWFWLQIFKKQILKFILFSWWFLHILVIPSWLIVLSSELIVW